MKSGMRHVIGGATLAAACLLAGELRPLRSVLPRAPARPSPQRQQSAPQRSSSAAAAQQRPGAPSRSRSPCRRTRGARGLSDKAAASLIAACTVVIEAGRTSRALAAMYFNRGDAFARRATSTGDQGSRRGDQARRQEHRVFRRGRAIGQGRARQRDRRLRSGDQVDPRTRLLFDAQPRLYEKRDYERAIADLTQAIKLNPRTR